MGRSFYQLLSAFVISIAGDWAFKIAIPVIVYDLTHSVIFMSFSFASVLLSYVLLLPIGGVIGDALPRRSTLYLADMVAAGCCIGICGYIALGGSSIYPVLVGLFALGAISAVCYPAFQGIVPQAVCDHSMLPRANSLFTASESLLGLVGPLLSASLLLWFSPRSVIWLNALSFLVSAVLVATSTTAEELERRPLCNMHLIRDIHIINDLRAGFAIAWSHPVLKWGTILFVVENFGTYMVAGNMMFLLTRTLDLSSSAAGLTIGVTSGGAVLGALIAPLLIRRVAPGPLILACLFVVAAGTSAMLVGSVAAIATSRAIVLSAEAVIVVTMFTFRQRVVPPRCLGRVAAVTRTISALPIPLATITGGYVLSVTGGDMRTVIGGSAIILLLCGIGGLLTPFIKPVAESSLGDEHFH